MDEKDDLADIPVEGSEVDDLLDETTDDVEENEDSQDSQSKTNDNEDAPSQEGEEEDTPDENKETRYDKRWKQREEKLTAKHDEEMNALRAEVDGKFNKLEESKDSDILPPHWVTLYGDSIESRNAYIADQEARKVERETLKKEILDEQTALLTQAKKVQQDQDAWVEDEVQKLVDNGKKFDKNELLKVAIEYQPIDAQGNYDLGKAYEILQLKKSANKDTKNINAKKKVASDTMSSNNSSETDMDKPQTMESMRGKSFSSLTD